MKQTKRKLFVFFLYNNHLLFCLCFQTNCWLARRSTVPSFGRLTTPSKHSPATTEENDVIRRVSRGISDVITTCRRCSDLFDTLIIGALFLIISTTLSKFPFTSYLLFCSLERRHQTHIINSLGLSLVSFRRDYRHVVFLCGNRS